MKIILKRTVLTVLIVSITLLISTFSNADIQKPAKVRIGIFYNEASTNANSAVASFTVNAVNGLQLGYYNNSVFNVLYEEPSSNNVTIRKDSFFTNTTGVLKEYNPTTNPAGDKIGPFHIQIGANLADYNSTIQQLQALKQVGIPAYPVFVDVWQIWTGFYTDLATAQNDLITNIQVKIPGIQCGVVQPTANRIVAASSTGDALLVFGSDVLRFQIHPKIENIPYLLKINNRDKNRYRGDLEVRRFASSDMTVINVLPLEQYVYGVVPSEIESWSKPEALKAQAVCARTYALGKIGSHSKIGFDLCPTMYCQVYKGYNEETPATNKAVDDTAGKIMTYNGKLVEAVFFSSDGGMTEDVNNVWGGGYPYLASVEDKFESGKSYKYNWQVDKTATWIRDTLLLRGYDLGNIVSVQATKFAPSGRVTELVIKGTRSSRTCRLEITRTVFGLYSQWYTIATNADVTIMGGDGTKVKTQLGTRNIMTADGLKQAKITNNSVKIVGGDGVKKTILVIPSNYTFTGKGWGHAVGLSQEGAKGMADAGFTYDQILKHYFTGITIQ